MGDMSGGNCSLNNHILYQRYCDSNNVDVSIGYGFYNIHTLSQFEYLIMFKNIDGDFKKGYGYVSSGYGF